MSMSIVITGEGVVSAIGLNKKETLSSLLKRQTGISYPSVLPTNHKDLPVGEVKLTNDEMKSRLGVKDEYISRTSLLGMMAIDEALEDAHLNANSYANSRVMLISGTTVGGMDTTEHYFAEMLSENKHLKCIESHDCGNTTQMMASRYPFVSEYTTISTACSSAANALILGANLIKSGQADIVIAGGTEALSVFHLNGFNSLMILDHQQCRPFDNTRAGLNLGEGAGYVVLESEEHARNRKADIHAYLTGYGNACDAYHQTASSADGEGAFLAMNSALAMAGLSPEDVQYINAHGTGTPNNDESEGVAIRRVFGGNLPAVSSTKSFTGHTTSASGGIEAVFCILALQHQFLPANLGWSEQMPEGITPTTGADHYEVRNVMCNSFGFGGNDSSFILSVRPSEGIALKFGDKKIKVLSRVEIDENSDLSRIKEYVKPMEVRRMGTLLRSTLLASFDALKEAGVECPDAIITGTILGCLDNSEVLLRDIISSDEASSSPTLFMQSTHNTIGSSIAIKLNCHGYNTTYTQGDASLEWAMRDAALLLHSNQAKTVLVGCHDETTEWYREVMNKLGHKEQLHPIHSVALVLTCDE